jgi:enamine deaminase RidA (YjgF/YER057c/UK114 family)
MELQEIIRRNLLLHALELPDPPKPGGSYVSVNVVKGIAYVAIQVPKLGGDLAYHGRLGQEFTTAEGYMAAELCALNVLGAMQKYVGFERVLALNHIDVYYQAIDGWDESPKVVNGASDLFLKVLGDAGIHSRAIFGVQSLPKNFVVGLTATFTLNN